MKSAIFTLAFCVTFYCTSSVALSSKTICLEWIDPFWEQLVLNEPRDATIEDWLRNFYLMDSNADELVTLLEFSPFWQSSTQMTSADTNATFAWWATTGDSSDPQLLTMVNYLSVWDYFNADMDELLTKDEFTQGWAEKLPAYPNEGCPGQVAMPRQRRNKNNGALPSNVSRRRT